MLKLIYILCFSLAFAGFSPRVLAQDFTAAPALAQDVEAQAVQDDDLPDGDLDLPEGDFDEEPALDETPEPDSAANDEAKKDKDNTKNEDSDQADAQKDSSDQAAESSDNAQPAADEIPAGPGEDDVIPDLEPVKSPEQDNATEKVDKPREDLSSPWDEDENHATRPVIGGGVHEVEVGSAGRVSEADKGGNITDEAWFWPAVGGGGALVVVAAGAGTAFLVYSMLNADKGSATIVLE